MLWQLQPIDVNTSNAANRIASLFPTLVNFYIFLQDWGMIDKKISLSTFKEFHYD